MDKNKVRCGCNVCGKPIYESDLDVTYYVATLIHQKCLDSDLVKEVESVGGSFSDKLGLFNKLKNNGSISESRD